VSKDHRRILVCGGRDFDNKEFVFDRLDMLDGKLDGIDVIINGGAKGADTLATRWAKIRGIDVVTFEAKWKTYGKSAGAIRNAQMLTDGKPDLVVAFPGGKGTINMIRQAKKKGITILVVSK
jgi:hypothetical protein